MKAVQGMRAFTSHERRAIRLSLIEQYGAYCQICLQKGKSQQESKILTDVLYEDNSFSIDHIKPLADGGTNTRDNMQPTHVACNERKGSAAKGGRVRSNRRPRTLQKGVTQVTSARLAYSTSSN